MSVKRAVLIFACAIAVGSVGDAVIVGTSATGSAAPTAVPKPPSRALEQPTATLQAAPGSSRAALHLPTTIHLTDRSISTLAVGSSHLVINATLGRKGKPAGGAVFTCAASSGRVSQCHSAFALSRGVILARLVPRSGGGLTGRVVGGTGSYAGASGTVTTTPKKPGVARLTISYSVD